MADLGREHFTLLALLQKVRAGRDETTGCRTAEDLGRRVTGEKNMSQLF